jgi:3-phenylpropionate/trans-cinnamate dioxygenase ferredoxin subunit
MGQLVRLCAASGVKPNSAQRVDIAGHRIALVRVGDDFYAIGDRCSHANFSLSEGEIYPDDLTVECWKHGSEFSLVTGEAKTLPATKPVPVYRVTVEGDDVMVELP